MLREQARRSHAALAVLERELRSGFDLVVSIGTTSVFPYIAAPVVIAYLFLQRHFIRGMLSGAVKA